MNDDIYTGRTIGAFADAHALLEPTIAVLVDMKKRGINEIYSLGDNIGVGPNPFEVMELLQHYGVISLAGNSEEYCTLGIEPFKSYFKEVKRASHLWTLSKLDEEKIGQIKLFPRFIEMVLGGEKIALCHFINDVRFDYYKNSTWSYQSNIAKGKEGYMQFMHTNSPEQIKNVGKAIRTKDNTNPEMGGIISARKEPLFNGKQVDAFKAVLQGHVHWKMYEKSPSTHFYSIRAVGIAYGKDSVDTASYVLLKERTIGGYDFEEVLVKYDRDKMIHSVQNSTSPDRTIEKFTGISR